jgi:hypothetical protein
MVQADEITELAFGLRDAVDGASDSVDVIIFSANATESDGRNI